MDSGVKKGRSHNMHLPRIKLSGFQGMNLSPSNQSEHGQGLRLAEKETAPSCQKARSHEAAPAIFTRLKNQAKWMIESDTVARTS